MADLHERLRNLLFLVPYVVRHRGVTLVELTERLGISEEQLLKEIDFLLMIGRPPFFPNDMLDIYHEGGRVFVDLHQSLENPPALTVLEALALAAAAKIFADENDTDQTSTAVRVAVDKVVRSLPPDAQRLLTQLSRHFLILSGGSKTPHLATIRKAIDENRELELKYFTASRGEITQRTVLPYGLFHRNGTWYLAAHCTHRDAERVFRLSRISSAKLSDRIFDGPPDEFNVAEFVKRSITVPARGARLVVIRFSAEVARWIKERWGSEYLTEQTDGSLIASLHDVSDEYVLSYVASFAGEAKIEEPPELAEKLKQQISYALEQYN